MLVCQALEFEPDDKACLVARSKCYLQQGDASNALKDAEASLKDDSKYHRVSEWMVIDTHRTRMVQSVFLVNHRGCTTRRRHSIRWETLSMR